MNRRATDKLSEDLKAQAIDSRVDEYGQLVIDIGPIHIWIQARPWYCDRGRWQVNAESKDQRLTTIDWADCFPRYYFHTGCLALELASWLSVRMKHLEHENDTVEAD